MCVEVGLRAGFVVVRDGKDPAGAPLMVAPAQWRAFCAALKDGSLDG